ncbi:hypothetical protein [Nocardioides sp.]|uniref:hypothetical protein n=1 Tax=Nocardioides sp. TaxID=35761 RepID=UPI0026077FBA|nr:hypothetical protein [Nocardioides sp.]MDI6912475.1 hypothetical protein [Nocardioides sp.]
MTTADEFQAPISAAATVRGHGLSAYCPWRHLGELDGIELLYHTGGPLGITRFADNAISLRVGMTTNQRRSTLAHELVHIERGPGRGQRDSSGTAQSVTARADELIVEMTAAIRLVPAAVLEHLPTLVTKHGRRAAIDFLGIDGAALDDALALCAALA